MEERPDLYIDTSVLSFYFADDVPKERDITREFFKEIKKGRLRVFISDVVIEEVKKSPTPKRIQIESLITRFNLPQLKLDKVADNLAMEYVKNKVIPSKYEADAMHIAIPVINRLDAIVSWNFRHIVKLKTIIRVNEINKRLGYKEIIICSPTEVLE